MEFKTATSQSKTSIIISCCAMAVLAVAVFLHQVGNSDIFWQLKTGELTMKTGSVPTKDPFSFTREGKRWIDQEWLSGIIFHLTEKRLGFEGLSLLSVVLGASLCSILFLAFFYSSGSLERSMIFCTAAIFLSAFRLQLMRPEIFGFIFFASFLMILSKNKNPGIKSLAYLIPLQILWTNMHGSALLGPVLAFFMIEGISKKIIFVALLLTATAASPFGTDAITFPASHMLSGFTIGNVSDWKRPVISLSHLDIPAVGAIALALVAAFLAITKRKFDIGLIVISSASLFAGMRSARFLPFAIISSLFLISSTCKKNGHKPSILKIPLIAVLITIFSATAYIDGIPYSAFVDSGRTYLEKGRPGGIGIDEAMLPSDAASFIEKHLRGGRIFNDMGYGGYLIYRLWPQEKVFIDTRTELYGDEFIKEYSDALFSESAFDTLVSKYRLSHVIYDKRQILAEGGPLKFLVGKVGWRPVFESGNAVIFIKMKAD